MPVRTSVGAGLVEITAWMLLVRRVLPAEAAVTDDKGATSYMGMTISADCFDGCAVGDAGIREEVPSAIDKRTSTSEIEAARRRPLGIARFGRLMSPLIWGVLR